MHGARLFESPGHLLMRQTDLLHEGHCLLMLMALQPTWQVHPKAHDPPMDKGRSSRSSSS